MDIPKSFTAKKKDGEEVTVETSIRVGEIKKICEPEPEEQIVESSIFANIKIQRGQVT